MLSTPSNDVGGIFKLNIVQPILSLLSFSPFCSLSLLLLLIFVRCFFLTFSLSPSLINGLILILKITGEGLLLHLVWFDSPLLPLFLRGNCNKKLFAIRRSIV